MGGGLTKQELVARLDALDKEELEINKELRQLQIQLNEIVPEDERIKVRPLEGEEDEEEEEENEEEEDEEGGGDDGEDDDDEDEEDNDDDDDEEYDRRKHKKKRN